MNTGKPISTISWNTETFLRQKLDELLRAKRLDFWAFIYHKPEDDEAGEKPHFHVYLEPSKRMQTAVLKDEFKEFDPNMPDKPLGVLAFRNSKFDDWYEYALHDEEYLATKMQTRKFHYTPDDVKSSDPDELHERVYTVDLGDLTPQKRLQDFKKSGKSFTDAVITGIVPIAQIHQYEKAWGYIPADRHQIDQTTGEVRDSEDS